MHNLPDSANRLHYQGIYPCPICRVGQIQGMPLMDAMACEACRHIFVADLEQQLLKMTDRQPPLTWRWTGKTWVGAHLQGVEWGWVTWIFAAVFVILPATLIGVAAYTFPPTPGSRLAWLPLVWTGLTFLFHLAVIIWLLMEFYQFPLGVYLRTRRRRLLRR